MNVSRYTRIPQVSVAQLTKDYDNLVGDVLVSAGMIAYSGPFTPDFRQKLVKGWQEKLLDLGVPHSHCCDVRLTLADPVQVVFFVEKYYQLKNVGPRRDKFKRRPLRCACFLRVRCQLAAKMFIFLRILIFL